MGNSKIGSPFEFHRDWENAPYKWDGAVFRSPSGCVRDFNTGVLLTAIEAWTPKPPEGWEEDAGREQPEGYWNPLTGKLYESDPLGELYACKPVAAYPDRLVEFGCVPVRKTKPAVPEWTKQIAFELGLIPEGSEWFDHAGKYLAENCVPKADADEMLAALKKYLPLSTSLIPELVALIERMEGKR